LTANPLRALSNGHGQFEDFKEPVITFHSAISLAEKEYEFEIFSGFTSALKSILTCATMRTVL
jgi:hypothetical protein